MEYQILDYFFEIIKKLHPAMKNNSQRYEFVQNGL